MADMGAAIDAYSDVKAEWAMQALLDAGPANCLDAGSWRRRSLTVRLRVDVDFQSFVRQHHVQVIG